MIQMPDEAYDALYVIKTHYIMRVLKFNPETQTVDLIQDVYEFTNTPLGNMAVVNEFGQEVVVGLKEPTILHNIPVKQLRWGQFEIQCCPVAGDTGYIEVMTNDIRDWMQTGSRSIPWSDSHFIKESCVFVPFVPNLINRSTTYPANNNSLVIRSKNASFVITDNDDDVVNITTNANTTNINSVGGISCNGDVAITGNLSTTGNITASGSITATGEVHSDDDVTAGGVSLKNHKHQVPAANAIIPPEPGVPPPSTTAPVEEV